MIKKVKSLYKKYEEIINYLIVGGLTTVVSLVSFYLLRFLIFSGDSQLDIQISNVVSWFLTVLFAFFANRRYVFKSHEEGKNKLKEIVKFYLSRITTLFVEMLSMWILTDLVNIDDKISKLIVQVILVILNYIFSKLFVFRGKEN